MKRQNEINAINALLEILPFFAGGRYVENGSPDENNSQCKNVDYVLAPCANNLPNLAVEHTRVEAFRGQMTYVNRSYDIVHEVDIKCQGQLPPDRYFILVVSHILVESLRKQAIKQFISFVVPWIVTTAQTLLIDNHKTTKYAEQDLLLMCGGSHPKVNGTIGRISNRPNNQEDLAKESLWFSIEHGLGKFSKYKRLGYDTVLSLEDISGAIRSSMLLEIDTDIQRKALISTLVDYLIVFASNEDKMIVANVWKEKQLRYNYIPFNRRFDRREGKWFPLE